jgi:hypothetical protein
MRISPVLWTAPLAAEEVEEESGRFTHATSPKVSNERHARLASLASPVAEIRTKASVVPLAKSQAGGVTGPPAAAVVGDPDATAHLTPA